MINSKIVDNKPICGNCGSSYVKGIRDYKSVEMSDKRYVLFQYKCYDCRRDNQYLSDIMLDKTTRYEVGESMKVIGD